MAAETPGDRMLASLPAVWRGADASGDLGRLLGAFEALFFDGLERQTTAIPQLFAPLGDGPDRTPDRFVPWLAAWLGFRPYALFPVDALRRIAAGIVPLLGLRGTREHLVRLLELCFDGEVAAVDVDDRPRGLAVGASRIGEDTQLIESRPFRFRVVVDLDAEADADADSARRGDLERRLRAVVEFAKPAHTAYELQWRTRPRTVATPEA